MPADFFKEVKNAATTAASNIPKQLSNASAVTQGINGLGKSAQDFKKQALGGATNFGTNLLNGLVPGVSVDQAFGTIAQGSPTLDFKSGYNSGYKAPVYDKPPFDNVLNKFASYNYIFTLSVLPPEHVNDPDNTYRKGIFGPIILASAGTARTEDMIKTAYGTYDYYIDNVNIEGVMGINRVTGNSNSLGIRFEVIEPYSMGLFFQTLQTAAFQAKYKSYIQIPLLFSIQFKGHLNPNQLSQNITRTSKFMPIRIREIEMNVTGKGCVYQVQANAWNEVAWSDTYNKLRTDVSIRADKGNYTIQNILQTGENSLQSVMNKNFKKQVDSGNAETFDEIVVLFPIDPSTNKNNVAGNEMESQNENFDRPATVNGTNQNTDIYGKLGLSQGTNTTMVQQTGAVNLIGQAGLGLNVFSEGNQPFAKDNFAYDKEKGTYKRGAITIDPNNSMFTFTQGSTVQDVINNVILTSDYGRQALDAAKRTPEGQIVWWRIETHAYIKPGAEDPIKGKKAKILVYRVLPYLINASMFSPVNTKTPGLEKVKKQSLKEYNYIYTGKNTDILDFNITFNAGFYKQFNADGGKNSEAQQGGYGKTSGAAVTQGEQKQNQPEGDPADTQLTPQVIENDKLKSNTGGKGGGPLFDDAATNAARQFHDIATNGVDMIELNLKILGDPFYIGDSGIGNYSAAETEYQNLNADGALNYQKGEVYITVNFRTPIDINTKTGFYNFGDTRPVQQFSGLYRVQNIDSIFTKGKFIQNLKLYRIPGQDNPNASEKKNMIVLAAQGQDELEAGDSDAAIEAATGAAFGGEFTGTPITEQESEAYRASLGDFNG